MISGFRGHCTTENQMYFNATPGTLIKKAKIVAGKGRHEKNELSFIAVPAIMIRLRSGCVCDSAEEHYINS